MFVGIPNAAGLPEATTTMGVKVLVRHRLIVAVVAVDDMRRKKLMKSPRYDLDSDEAGYEASHGYEAGRLFCVASLFEVALGFWQHAEQGHEYLQATV